MAKDSTNDQSSAAAAANAKLKTKDYLRELAKQKIANLRGSAREVLDQTIAG